LIICTKRMSASCARPTNSPGSPWAKEINAGLEAAPIGIASEGKTDKDARSYGELLIFPESKEPICARTPTIPHRTHMGAVQGPLARAKTNHPLGCHRPRIPDRLVFEKLVEVLVFGCAYWRVANEGCSATTLRRRRDEWIEAGVMDHLRAIVIEAYDRFIGLLLGDLAVDCCITKASCGGEKAGSMPTPNRPQKARKRYLQSFAKRPILLGNHL
jgi:hypothetical protein